MNTHMISLAAVLQRPATAEHCAHPLSVRKSIVDHLPWHWPVLHPYAYKHMHSHRYSAERTKIRWAVSGVVCAFRKSHLVKTSWTVTRLLLLNCSISLDRFLLYTGRKISFTLSVTDSLAPVCHILALCWNRYVDTLKVGVCVIKLRPFCIHQYQLERTQLLDQIYDCSLCFLVWVIRAVVQGGIREVEHK